MPLGACPAQSNGAQGALLTEIETTKAKLREQTYLQMDLVRSCELKQEYETVWRCPAARPPTLVLQRPACICLSFWDLDSF